ncbi:hypothetical protein T01_2713, partial [Trichinella spiralis]
MAVMQMPLQSGRPYSIIAECIKAYNERIVALQRRFFQ